MSLAGRLPADADALMTAEVKSIPLAHALSVRMGIPYVIARKTRKPYMVGAQSVEVLSITTGAPQKLWLDGKDQGLVEGQTDHHRRRRDQHRQHARRHAEAGRDGRRRGNR